MPRCPSCFTPLTRVEEANIHSAVCGNCFGTWIDAGQLMRRAQLDIRLAKDDELPSSPSAAQPAGGPPTTPLEELAQIVQESNSRDMLRCAACEKPMVKGRFHPMIPVEVDRCLKCGYIWLDAGEMSLVRRLYAELMTTQDPEVARRRDKVAAVAAEWHAHRQSVRDAQQAVRDVSRNFTRSNDAFDLLAYLLRSV
jgi:Zn-finger nucleic acid-binding protein